MPTLTAHAPPQALRVNGLEQLCNNLASERLQLFSSQMLLAQEEVWGAGHGDGRGTPNYFPGQRPSLVKRGHCAESSAPKPPPLLWAISVLLSLSVPICKMGGPSRPWLG